METKNITAQGKLRFGNTNVVVDIPKGIVEYYYALIPKAWPKARQMYNGHITVVRTGIETWPKSLTSIFDGREVEFVYEPVVRYSQPYYFLNCYSDDIGRIRQSLGLTYYRGSFDCYHITIANTKDQT